MDQLRLFGDVSRNLASAVKRSLVAAKALVRALRTGHEIANQMMKVREHSLQKINCCTFNKLKSSLPGSSFHK